MTKRYKDFDASGEFTGAFVVDESQLRRLVKEIGESLGRRLDMSFKVNFVNNVSYETENLEDILSEENRSTDRIESIKIEASSGEYGTNRYKSVSIEMSKWRFKLVRFSISGRNKDWVYSAKNKLEERINPLKQWYSFIWTDNLLVGSVVFVALWVSITVLVIQSFEIQTYEKKQLIVYILVPFNLVLFYLIGKVRNFLFPSFVFEIGAQIKRHKRIEELRNKLFWTVFIALILSWFVSKVF